MSTHTDIPPTTLAYFLALADDAPNWGGAPWTDCGNVDGTARGACIVALVERGLIVHHVTADGNYAEFTEAGAAFAAEHGIAVMA